MNEATIYLLKFAFTSGLKLVRARRFSWGWTIPSEGTAANKSQAAETWEEALEKLEKMRANKIATLEKQLKKVRGMKFEEPKQ